MNSFKIGDLVIANKLSDAKYGLTNKKNNFIGEVLEVYDTKIRVKTISWDIEYSFGREFNVYSECFDFYRDNRHTIKVLKERGSLCKSSVLEI